MNNCAAEAAVNVLLVQIAQQTYLNTSSNPYIIQKLHAPHDEKPKQSKRYHGASTVNDAPPTPAQDSTAECCRHALSTGPDMHRCYTSAGTVGTNGHGSNLLPTGVHHKLWVVYMLTLLDAGTAHVHSVLRAKHLTDLHPSYGMSDVTVLQ